MPPASPLTAGLAFTYEVLARPAGEQLAITAWFAKGTDPELTVEAGAEPFVRELEVASSQAWVPVAPTGSSWRVPACNAGCRIRYRYALREAARVRDDVRIATASGPAILAPPSTWLLRPMRAERGCSFRFHVTVPAGDSFVTGVPAVPGTKDTYEARTSDIFQLPYSAFGRLDVEHVGVVDVALLSAATDASSTAAAPAAFLHRSDVIAWVRNAEDVVARFYGRFPVPHLLLLVRPVPGHDPGFGTTIGYSGASIAIDVGAEAARADLSDDWVLVHEMVHTALPDLLGPQHWLEEGLATYVEPLARARAGVRTPEQLWKEWIQGMPKGLPEPGDEGLDGTPTWGRTYWGGALFCLLADVAIREKTRGTHSLDDALRAIVREGGTIAVRWPIERVLAVGDGATGTNVLRELYDRMAHASVNVDLPALWARLGVVPKGPSVVFEDEAPLASVRQSMTLRR